VKPSAFRYVAARDLEHTMKHSIILTIVALSMYQPASASQPSSKPLILFTCSVGNKTVSVTTVGDQLTYHYGTQAKEEMSITGTAKSGNIFWLTQRFAGIENQMRFKSGDFSYIVYDSEGNGNVGAAATSGLVVMKGTKTIADKSCAKYTEFSASYDFNTLPEDTDAYSAM
jgi:hypothetical protein